MTPLKRHRFITFLLLFACLSLSLSTGAQRRKRNSASGNDSLKVDSALVDTLSIDTVAPKRNSRWMRLLFMKQMTLSYSLRADMPICMVTVR